MANGSPVTVTFWGVRGSIAVPGPDTLRYGGNTSCCEVRCGEHVLVFDAGTGIRPLGQKLIADGTRSVDLFFTHTHLDHICGLPFFVFAFDERNSGRVWAGHLTDDYGIRDALGRMMSPPLFPVPLDIFKASVTFVDFTAGETLNPFDDVVIRTAPLNHPDNATGYRVEHAGKSVCYITDTCHVPGAPNREILRLIDRADIVVYDATFTDDEFPRFAEWGHSTWQEAVRLCKSARVRTLALFHHAPERTDDELDEIGRAAKAEFPGALVAREGMTLTP